VLSAYHNTNELVGAHLVAAAKAAARQEEAVLLVFARAGRALSPSEVWQLTTSAGHDWPLTSIRRAITNLTKSQRLQKLDEQRKGYYGRPEFLWRRPPPHQQGELFARTAAQ